MNINCSDIHLFNLIKQSLKVKNTKDADIEIQSLEGKIIVGSKIFRKPIKLKELIDYLSTFKDEQSFKLENFKYFYKKKKVVFQNKETLLTEKENDLLNLLINSKTTVSTNNILKQVWNYNDFVNTTTLDTHIYRLRQKLESLGLQNLINSTDDGYIFDKSKL